MSNKKLYSNPVMSYHITVNIALVCMCDYLVHVTCGFLMRIIEDNWYARGTIIGGIFKNCRIGIPIGVLS